MMAGQKISLDQQVELRALFPVSQKDFKYSKTSAPELLYNIKFGHTSITFINKSTAKIQKYIASTTVSQNGEGYEEMLVYFGNPTKNNVSPVLIQKIKPKHMIYSKNEKNESKNIKITSFGSYFTIEYLKN